MIASLNGLIKHCFSNFIVIEVGGIGFGVHVPVTSSFKENVSVQVYTHMHWNQESGPSLYGFSTIEEKNMFVQLMSCSGIGPKIGLAIIGSLSPSQFVAALVMADIACLSAVPGIGKKKAESIILQLKDSVSKFNIEPGQSPVVTHIRDVGEALQSLGYSRNEIANAVEWAKGQVEVPAFDSLMRASLAFLSKKSL